MELLDGTQLGNITLLDGVEGLSSSSQGRQSLIEIFLTINLSGLSLVSSDLGNGSFCLNLLLLFLSDSALSFDHLGLLVDLLRLNHKLGLQLFKSDLHLTDRLLSHDELVVTITIAISLLSNFLTLLSQESLE